MRGVAAFASEAEAPPPEMFGVKKVSATVNMSFSLL
jgi:hypothetical protein